MNIKSITKSDIYFALTGVIPLVCVGIGMPLCKTMLFAWVGSISSSVLATITMGCSIYYMDSKERDGAMTVTQVLIATFLTTFLGCSTALFAACLN